MKNDNDIEMAMPAMELEPDVNNCCKSCGRCGLFYVKNTIRDVSHRVCDFCGYEWIADDSDSFPYWRFDESEVELEG